MSKTWRIFFELFAPPFLATIWLTVASFKSETIADAFLGFLPCLMFAYIFGIIPAILYTVAIEFWFKSGLRARCGSICTVCLSALLGAMAGFLSAAIGVGLGFLFWFDCIHFLWIGIAIGLFIGICVSVKQISSSH